MDRHIFFFLEISNWSKAGQPWQMHSVALCLLVSPAADVVMTLIIMSGFITEKWYAALGAKIELFMFLINNRNE